MAVDPNIIKKLSEDLDNLDDAIDDLSKKVSTNLNKQFAATSEAIKDIVSGLEKGKDVSTEAATALKKAQLENRRLGLDQNRIQDQLKKVQDQINTRYTAKLQKQKESLSAQLEDNIVQQELNEKLIDYLRTLDKASENEKKITEEKKKQTTITGFLNNKLKETAKFFTAAGIFKFFVDAILKADDQATKLGKSFGVSASAAYAIRQDFVEYSRTANNTFVTTTRLLKAQSELSEQLGIAVQFSGEELETFSRLTEIVGLTAQEAGTLAKFSAATGISSKAYVAQVRTAAFYSQQANKIHVSDKELLSTIGKLSAGITSKFQANPKALAEAVIQAKSLGSTLEQVDKIGESLLNFESSIENELKAELITGRQLNFERARAAALTGDQATLMQEVASQVGTLEDFNNMNVIAQKSLAEAFGMSRDEMADMLMKQQAIAEYGDEAAKLNKEQLEDMKRRNMTAEEYLAMSDNQRSIQEKFNDAMLKLQDIIGNLVAGPFGQMLNIISSILEHTTAVAAIMGGAMVANLIRVVSVMKQAKKISYGAAVIKIIESAYESLGKLPGIGMILAGAAAAAGISYLASQSAQQVEDGTAPASKGPFTITDAYGATAITAKGDGLAVSPNINRGGIMDMMPLIAAVNEVKAAIGSLANKPSPAIALNVDGQKLGEVVGRQPETGTNQYQNAYRLA